MLVAAHTAGGRSTLDVLIGLAVLMWTLAGLALLLGWLSRLAGWRRRSPLRSLLIAIRTRGQRLGTTASADPDPIPAAAKTGAPGASAGRAPDAAARLTGQAAAGTSAAAPPGQLSSGAGQATSAWPTAIPGARLSPEQLEPLGEHLDGTRRFAVAEARVAKVLSGLPSDRWLVERYVLFAAHRIPFLIAGETGVFALWATSGPMHWQDLAFLNEMAGHVENALPGYTGDVRPGVCRALEPGIEPRWWCRPGEPGAWVMGVEWLLRWLEHFGPENGLGVKDLERLRELAGPRWGRPVTDVPLSAHIPTIG